MRETMILIVVDALEIVYKGLEKARGTENQRKNRDYRDHSIVKIG